MGVRGLRLQFIHKTILKERNGFTRYYRLLLLALMPFQLANFCIYFCVDYHHYYVNTLCCTNHILTQFF